METEKEETLMYVDCGSADDKTEEIFKAATQDILTHTTPYFQYDVNERPPLPMLFILAFQNILTSFGLTLVMCFTVADLVCANITDPIRGKLLCTSLFLVGLTTLLQSALGIRLPVFQGVSGAFIGPLLSMKTAEIWSCDDLDINSDSLNSTLLQNSSSTTNQELMYHRITELQGSLMLSGLVTEVFLGVTGLVGFITQFVGPITVSVTITSLGLGMYPLALRFVGSHIPVGLSGIVLMIICILYLDKIRIKIPQKTLCWKKEDSVQLRRKPTTIPIFKAFPVVLTVGITWSLCGILTVTGVFPNDPAASSYRARTDTRGNLITLSPWIFFPYPGQFGPLRFNTAIFIGFISSYLASCVESVGDYITISRATGKFPPPRHAFNRGILVEGLMGVLAGALGAGHATTSYSGNIAIISLTEVASRSVLVLAGIICMLLGIIGKFGAFMTSIPDPVIGATAFVSIGWVVAIGISSLQRVNLTSTRNIGIIGISIYVGLFTSEWLKINRNSIKTGSSTGDEIVKLVLGTPMFLAGITSVILDNTTKGTRQERGIEEASVNKVDDNRTEKNQSVYDFPGVNRLQRRIIWFRKIPFFQPYQEVKE